MVALVQSCELYVSWSFRIKTPPPPLLPSRCVAPCPSTPLDGCPQCSHPLPSPSMGALESFAIAFEIFAGSWRYSPGSWKPSPGLTLGGVIDRGLAYFRVYSQRSLDNSWTRCWFLNGACLPPFCNECFFFGVHTVRL